MRLTHSNNRSAGGLPVHLGWIISSMVLAALCVLVLPVSSACQDNSDWMAPLSDDLLISELTIPGTHETMALYNDPMDPFGFAKCQDMSLEEQLAWGVRILDIRCKHYLDMLLLYHGEVSQLGNLPFHVLRVCKDFLQGHPTETILIRIQISDGSFNDFTLSEYLPTVLADYQEFIWQSNNYSTIPTLGELRGKMVIFQDFYQSPETPVGPEWSAPYWSIQDDYANYCCHADALNKDPEAKFNLVYSQLLHAYDGTIDSFYVNFLSCSPGAPCLANPHGLAWGCGIPHADGVNEWMLWWLQDAGPATANPWFWRRLRLGVIYMDFIDEWFIGDYANSMTKSIIDFNRPSFPTENPDWMSNIIRPSMLISELAIPGTQGSMSGNAEVESWGNPYTIVPSQSMSLETQLKAGIRAIEVACQPENGPFKIVLPDRYMEGLNWSLPLEFGKDVLETIVQFLMDYPSETVLLRVQKKCILPPEFGPCDIMAQDPWEWWVRFQWYITEDGGNFGPSGEFVRYGDYIWQSDDYSSIPTLNEVRGKIVILQDFESPVQFGLLWSSFAVQDDLVVNNLEQKWQLVQEFQVSGCNGLFEMRVNYLSNFVPWLYADEAGGSWKGPDLGWEHGLNKMFYDFTDLWSCTGPERGVVMMDYPGPGLIDAIINSNDFNLTSIDDPGSHVLPLSFEVAPNYPNPFNPMTTIEYSLPERSLVKIEVFNMLGQKVRTLVDREKSAGTYTITWDGRSEKRQAVSTGVYFYRVQVADHVQTRNMLLLK